ncbi:MAG: hypothetical protein JSU94_21420 [Phycisphaerales bacterium]|nr:MAG: hypothetical protein JSU94_21420 [Phycisphaerales bacterium]
MVKKNTAFWAAGAAAVLVAAYALGLGIRYVRQPGPEVRQSQETERPAQAPAVKTASFDETEQTPVEPNEPELVVVEEAEQEPAVVEQAEQEAEEPVEEQADAFSEAAAADVMQSIGGWRQVWANLNLTEEEKARLREGFRLAMERWRNMSEEERQAERERLRGMWERWQGMSEEERQEAMGRMRERFEDWRQSGAVELPELTLD